LALFAYGYAPYTLVTRPGALPGGTAMAWLSAWVWVLGLTPMVTFGLLLFPDGRLLSARWRPLAWLAAAAVALPALANALMPGPPATGQHRRAGPVAALAAAAPQPAHGGSWPITCAPAPPACR
jgi:hypothetical protein